MAENRNPHYILLVEDNPHDADLTCIGFRRNRITNPIVQVRNGEEALDFLFGRGKYAERDPGDLPIALVLDLKLPKVSGLEVLKCVRHNERMRQLPVVVLSSSNEARDTAACREFGVISYVQKPVSFVEFEQAVTHIADALAQWCGQPVNSLAANV
jgi:two-component system response regulator